eukprot:Skav230559  [mRNA]  locus=scaffold7717:17184:43069:- [translate_table: standard]
MHILSASEFEECRRFKDFFFRKHCTVSKFLESQPPSYTAAVFDGDVVVAAPMRGLDRPDPQLEKQPPQDKWINHGADVQLYNRRETQLEDQCCTAVVGCGDGGWWWWLVGGGWWLVVVGGNYMVRNTPFARDFLMRWAQYYDRRPSGFSSADNGAIQLVMESLEVEGFRTCYDMYRNLTDKVTNLKSYWDYVHCTKEAAKQRGDAVTPSEVMAWDHGRRNLAAAWAAAQAIGPARAWSLEGGSRLTMWPRLEFYVADGVFLNRWANDEVRVPAAGKDPCGQEEKGTATALDSKTLHLALQGETVCTASQLCHPLSHQAQQASFEGSLSDCLAQFDHLPKGCSDDAKAAFLEMQSMQASGFRKGRSLPTVLVTLERLLRSYIQATTSSFCIAKSSMAVESMGSRRKAAQEKGATKNTAPKGKGQGDSVECHTCPAATDPFPTSIQESTGAAFASIVNICRGACGFRALDIPSTGTKGSRSGTGGHPAEEFPRSINASNGGARSHDPIADSRIQKADQRYAQGNKCPWESKKSTPASPRESAHSSAAMAEAFTRVNSGMEFTAAGVPASAEAVCTDDRPSQTRFRSCERCDSKAESGCSRNAYSQSRVARRSTDNWRGQGGDRPPRTTDACATPRDPSEVCGISSKTRDRRDRCGARNLTKRRGSKTQAHKVGRAGRRIFVILGSGWACLWNDIRVPDVAHKQVRFRSVEAYHLGSDGAAGWRNDSACLHPQLPRADCRECLNEFQAVQNALDLRFQVIQEQACDFGEHRTTKKRRSDRGAPLSARAVLSSDPMLSPVQHPAESDPSTSSNTVRQVQLASSPRSKVPTETHMHPMWIQDLLHLRSQSQHDADVMDTSQFHVRTWFLVNDHRRKSRIPRIVELSDDPSTWYESLTHAWMLEIDFRFTVTFSVVHPSSPHTTRENMMLDIILAQGVRRHEVPLLAVACSVGITELEFQRVAAIAPNPPSLRTIEAILDVESDCGFAICSCKHQGRDLAQPMPVNIVMTDGALILCSIAPISQLADESSFLQHFREPPPGHRDHTVSCRICLPGISTDVKCISHDQEADFSFLMQRGSRQRSRSRHAGDENGNDEEDPDNDPIEDSSPELPELPAFRDIRLVASSPSPVPSMLTWTLYTIGASTIQTRVDAAMPGPTISSMADAFGIPPQDIFAAHAVPYMLASQDEHVLIVERHLDRSDDDARALILVDIICHHQQEDGEPVRMPNQYTKVWLCPPHATFQHFAEVFHLHELLHEFPHAVTLECNGFPWGPHDATQIFFGHGDHVQILLGPYTSRRHQYLLRRWLNQHNMEVWDSPEWSDIEAPNASDPTASSSSHVCRADSMPPDTRFPESPFVTWYVSHCRHPLCDDPRLVTLGPDFAKWQERISRSWIDVFDPQAHMQITWVLPRPTAIGLLPDDRLPHLVIEQHPRHRQVAAVISVSKLDFNHVSLTQFAASVPEISSAATFRNAADVDSECSAEYACEVRYAGQIVPEHPPTRKPSGMSVNIIMTQLQRNPSEVSSFLQVSASSRRAEAKRVPRQPALVDSATSLGCSDFHINCCLVNSSDGDTGATSSSQAPVSRPSSGTADRLSDRQRAFSRMLTNFQEDLHTIWDEHAAVERDDEGKVMYVQTYYLSPDRHPRCTPGRPVRLHGQPGTWFGQMSHAWQDVMDLSTWTHVYVVSPRPATTVATEGTSAHILLVQHIDDRHRAILVTTCVRDQRHHAAAITDDTILKRQVAMIADQEQACYDAANPAICDATFRWQVISDQDPFPVQHGNGIQLSIEPAPSLPNRQQPITVSTNHTSTEPDTTSQGSARPMRISLEQAIPFLAPEEPSTEVPSSHGRQQTHRHCPLNPFRKLPAPGMGNLAEKLLNRSFPLRCHKEVTHASASQLTGIEVYTDGSYLYNAAKKDAVAAWSFVVVKYFSDGTEVPVGYAAATVAPNEHRECLPGIHSEHGSRQPDSCSAESEALFRALLWIIQSPDFQTGVVHTLVSDAYVLLNAAAAEFQFDARPFARSHLRPLYATATQLGHIVPRWQKAHVGCLYNEMADAIAKETARATDVHPMPNPFDLVELDLLPWAWYHMMHSLHDFSGDTGPNELCFPCPPPAQDADYGCWPQPVDHPATGKSANLNLRSATFNVQTLEQWTKNKTKTWASRQAILQEQAQQVHVLFLQETRSKTTSVTENDQWIFIQSQARSGQGGCAIWLNKKQAVVTVAKQPKGTEKTYWCRDACQVLHSDARCLIVQVKLPTCEFTLVSAHAPHSCSSESDMTAFWSQLTARLKPVKATTLVVGIDANARVGTCTSPAIGSFQAEPENFNGQCLRLFCEQMRLVAPTTTHDLVWEKPPLPGTWKSVNQWHRLDYILVPDSLQHADMTAHTDEFGFDTKQDDHVSVTLHIRADLLVSGQVASSPLRINFDRASMQTSEGKNRCRQLLDLFHAQHFPSLWLMPVDRQAALMHAFFQKGLSEAFPKKKHSAKAGVLSQCTVQHLTWSRQCRRRCRVVQQHILTSQLRAIMHEWLAQCPRRTLPRTPLYRTMPSPHWLKACHLAIAFSVQQVHATRAPLARSLQADEAAFIEQKTCAHNDVLASATGDKMWQVLRPHLPKHRTRVQDLQKRLHVQPADFVRHFAKIEAATIVSTEHVRDVIVQQNQQAHATQMDDTVDVADIPTLFEVEQAIAHLSARKAVPDCLVPELFLASPGRAAQLLFPALLSVVLQHQTCYTWKGGFLYPLHKKTNSFTEVTSYRAILLQQTIPKIFAHIARCRLHQQIAPRLQSLQLGGIQRMPVQFASQILTLMRVRANKANRSHAVLFVDLQSAFYTAVRSRIVSDRLKLGIAEQDDFVSIEESMQPPALETLGASQQLQSWIQSILVNSWSQVLPTGPSQLSTFAMMGARGTRPGDPISDLTFTSAMCDVLTRVVNDVAPLLPSIPEAAGSHLVTPITWVDDVAIFLEDSDPHKLISKLQTVTAAVHHRATAAGFQLNLRPGKTECLVRLQGRSSQLAKRHLLEFEQEGLPCDSPHGPIRCPLTVKYQHLGQTQVASMSLQPEADIRLARAAEALQQAAPLLRKPKLSLKTKCHLVHALVFSRMMFSVETWLEVPPSICARMNAFVLKTMRKICGMQNRPGAPCSTDEEVHAHHPFATAEDLMRIQRMRYLQKLFTDAPPLLRILMSPDAVGPAHAWFVQVQADIQYASTFFVHLQECPLLLDDFRFWQRKLVADGPRWKRLCNTLHQKIALNRQLSAQVARWEVEFDKCLGDSADPPAGEPAPCMDAAFPCPSCEKVFHSAKDLAVHELLAHRKSAAARHWMPHPSICMGCLQDYNTTQKLRQHLQNKNGRCLPLLQSLLFPMAQHEIDAVPTISTKSQKATYRVPIVRVPGPLLPTLSEWQVAAPQKAFPGEMQRDPAPFCTTFEQLVDWFHNVLPDLTRPFETFPGLSGLSPDAVREAVEPFADYVHASPWDHCKPWQFQRVAEVCEKLLAGSSAATPSESSRGPTAGAVPAVMPENNGEFYILYLYAGSRRYGDTHMWAEHMSTLYNCRIRVIALDIVFNAALCDMMRPDSQRFWHRLLADGLFVGLLMAPPCETWSVARWLSKLRNDHGPVPLRDANNLWGYKHLTVRQLHQVRVANALLHVSLLFAATATRVGVAWALEHPAIPSLEIAASIWKLPQVIRLQTNMHTKTHLILQGLYGGVAAKPTNIMAHALDSLGFLFHFWAVCGQTGPMWMPLIGKDSSGNFRTAKAKQYPPRLNAVFIEAFCQRMVVLRSLVQQASPPDFRELLGVLPQLDFSMATTGWVMGPDYAPR